MFCPKCGAEIEDTMKVCPKCGNAIESRVSEHVSTNDANTTAAPVPPATAAPVPPATAAPVPPASAAAAGAPEPPAGTASAAAAGAQQIPPAGSAPIPPVNGQQQSAYSATQPTPAQVVTNKSRVTAGILGIFLGGLGIHKFYLGYNTAGIIMLVIWLFGYLLGGIPTGIIGIIGLIEGIMYLTKSDRDFYEIYVAHKKEWF